MAYQVLARKYRPQRFSDVAGQEHVTRTLLNALAQGRIAHGYIFSGHRGIGKTSIARILAMALNCRTEIGSPQRPTPEPCGVCESCEEIRTSNAVDVLEIDAATNRGIDEIRELREAARYRPSRDRYKIYILDEAHQITDAAFNALLKTLEEPPDHVVFMMATTEPENIPQTIRSRCQHFSFHAVKFDDILAQLRAIATQENIVAEDAALALLAEAGDGSMRDALSIMDQAIASARLENGQPHLDAEAIRELMGSVPNTVFERLLEAISENQSAAVLEELNRLLNAGNSPVQLARQFVRYLRNTIMAKIGGEQTDLLQISPDERARVGRSALLFSEEDLTRFLQIMLRTFDELNYRQEQRFHLELGLIKLVHLQRLLPVEEFLSQLPPGTGTGAGRPIASATSGSTARTTSSAPVRPASAPAARPAPATPASTPEPSRPAFSPFEADRQRKITSEDTAPAPVAAPSAQPIEAAASVAPVSEPVPAPMAAQPAPAAPSTLEPVAASRPLTPLEAASRAVEAAPAKPSVRVGSAEPERTEGALALASTPAAEADLDRIAQAVCTALEREGHGTASVLLSSGNWTQQGDTIQVEVAIKRMMLSLTMNAEAEKICKNAMRSIGATQKLVFVPGEGNRSAGSKPAIAITGSIQSAALENPLVQKAKELFRGEIRSVLDLRDK
uniref:DNA polymerase III subunit gamma/tau n=1 Tax=Acidobacterium capsulatum TaxID=33075 RepID=A0A7V4XQF1_9BACT